MQQAYSEKKGELLRVGRIAVEMQIHMVHIATRSHISGLKLAYVCVPVGYVGHSFR